MKYPEFNIKELLSYTDDNPFILEIEKKYRTERDFELSDFENEYLIKNYKFKPYEFSTLTIEVGKITEERIKNDFNLDRPAPKVTINGIVGETDEWYHVRYKKSPNNYTYFWIYREEVGDLYEKIYTRYPVDFEELNKNFSKGKLFEHQESAVQFLLHQKKCFLMDTVGAGKTYSSIAATIAGKCKKVLIVCIAGKQLDWKKELAHWNQTCKIIWGENGWIEEPYTYTIIGCDVLMAYHEEAKRGKSKEIPYRPLYNEGYDCIIIDEVQKFRKPKAKKSEVIRALTSNPNIQYVWAMSATAIEKNEEFYDICRNLNLNVSDIIYTANDYHFNVWYAKYEEYAKRYCGAFKQNMKGGQKQFLRKTANTNTYELSQRIKFIQRRRRTEKMIEGFPEKIISELYFELSKKQQQEASELFEKYMLKKGNRSVEDTKDLVESILLRQFYAIQKVEHTVLSVLSTIEDDKTCIIFTNFVEEYERLKKKLSKYAVCVDSGMDGKRREAMIKEFMDNPDKKVLIGNIKSIGTGLNITKADVIYFNSPSWSSDEHEQAEGRAWRIGRKNDVEVFYCLFDGSIEEDVYRVSNSKQQNRNIFYGEQNLNS
jgi:SWI/SNF-related matrix-associated actin-dependent regulator 1 of chromatin subfamily A